MFEAHRDLTDIGAHDPAAREKQVNAFARLDEIMEIGRAEPSTRAADIVLSLSIL
jgi:hypothetical protein